MKSRRRIAALACAALSAGVLAAGPSSPAAAATASVTIDAGGLDGLLGIDLAGSGPTYEWWGLWDGSGRLSSTPSFASTSQRVRFEFYPGGHIGVQDGYDPWALSVGGAHVERAPGQTSLGVVPLPRLGDGLAFRANGLITAAGTVADDRVSIDVFQIPTVYPEQDLPQPITTAWGVQVGSFATSKNRGKQWTAGVVWPGRYILFITDTATGRALHATTDISPSAVPTIDLDLACFGFDSCVYTAGGPGNPSGGFHPLSPTRILDTRTGLGIPNGAVVAGDGRNSSLDPLTRRESAANHELKVTGRFGVPESGVSAVLLNVTGDLATPGSFLSIFPKPPRVGDVFNDQASYGALPTTSNLNLNSPASTANLVLARVGAGGKIRLFNSAGAMHVIADIAGWFGTGGEATAGLGFTGVQPQRLLDTRNGIGAAAGRVGPGDSRSIRVTGVAGIPTNAQSVVINITSAAADGWGYVTAYPDGEPPPNASNVNHVAGDVRANLAVVKVGANGRIRLLVSESTTDLIVDVLGSYGPGGGSTTGIQPVRAYDSRGGSPLAPYETRRIQITGVGAVPANATAVIANVTAVSPTAPLGYLSVWPGGTTRPTASNLNFSWNETVPNLVIVRLGAGGTIDVFNEEGSTHVLVDVMGYVT
jgi:hypothetical protein